MKQLVVGILVTLSLLAAILIGTNIINSRIVHAAAVVEVEKGDLGDVANKKKQPKPMPKFEQPACLPLNAVLMTLNANMAMKPLFAFTVMGDDVLVVANQDTGTVILLASCEDAAHPHDPYARVILGGMDFQPADLSDFFGPHL